MLLTGAVHTNLPQVADRRKSPQLRPGLPPGPDQPDRVGIRPGQRVAGDRAQSAGTTRPQLFAYDQAGQGAVRVPHGHQLVTRRLASPVGAEPTTAIGERARGEDVIQAAQFGAYPRRGVELAAGRLQQSLASGGYHHRGRCSSDVVIV